jgi:hypothetical protein
MLRASAIFDLAGRRDRRRRRLDRVGDEVEDQIRLFPTIAVPFLVGDVLEPIEVRHGRVVEEHVDAAKRAHRKVDQRLAFGRAVDVQIAANDRPPSPAKAKAAARPMLPPVPVMTQAFPDNLGDIRIPPRPFGGFPSWVGYTPASDVTLGTSAKYQYGARCW